MAVAGYNVRETDPFDDHPILGFPPAKHRPM